MKQSKGGHFLDGAKFLKKILNPLKNGRDTFCAAPPFFFRRARARPPAGSAEPAPAPAPAREPGASAPQKNSGRVERTFAWCFFLHFFPWCSTRLRTGRESPARCSNFRGCQIGVAGPTGASPWRHSARLRALCRLVCGHFCFARQKTAAKTQNSPKPNPDYTRPTWNQHQRSRGECVGIARRGKLAGRHRGGAALRGSDRPHFYFFL